MDGRRGCCIVQRHATGAHNISTMERIMRRFRPIAPKPVAGVTSSDASSSDSGAGNAFFRCSKPKRKYVRNNNNNNTEKRRVRRRKTVTVSSPEQNHPVPVTLPLLPETPDPKDLTLTVTNKVPKRNDTVKDVKRSTPRWLSFENHGKVEVETYFCCGEMDPAGGGYSSVTVERVTDAWVEGEWLGNTDEEKRAKLSVDTCPGFISDGYGRVTWTNGAYREVMGEGVVALVMKVSAAVLYLNPSFTCKVRVVQFVRGSGRERNSLTVPCDVWRMDCGGFAWRLDVKAALTLKLGC